MIVKEKANYIDINQLDDSYIIVVLFNGAWCFCQRIEHGNLDYGLLSLDKISMITLYGAGLFPIKNWFKKSDEMHAFKTTKEAFTFLIDKL